MNGFEDMMSAEDPARSGLPELERIIERQIDQRTGRRIRRLQVEVSEDRVVVHGCTGSYYVKQLALQAVLDVLDSTGSSPVELDIQIQA